MPITDTAQQPPAVEEPAHKLSELTTYELRDYRRSLSGPSRSSTRKNPVPPVRPTCKPGWTP